MTPWKPVALAGALVIAAGAGALWTPVLHGTTDEPQSDEPLVQALEVFNGSSRIGVTVRDADDEDAKQSRSGVIVDEVTSGSPAEKAGIKGGDAIVEFDGERVRSVRQFTRLVQETPIGRKVPAVVSRGGQRMTVTVTPERRSGLGIKWDRFDDRPFFFEPPEPPTPPAAPRAPRTPRPPAMVSPALPGFSFSYRGGGRLGISTEDLTDGLRDYFGVKRGVLVRSVTDGSPAAKAGLKAGDVITAINGDQVDEPSDISRALDRLDTDADFTLEITRDKKTQTLKGKLETRDRVRSRTRTIV